MDDYAKGQEYGMRIASRILFANPERLFDAAAEIDRQGTPFSRGVADAYRAEYERRTGGANTRVRGGFGVDPAGPTALARRLSGRSVQPHSYIPGLLGR
jgi:hypothetical protein